MCLPPINQTGQQPPSAPPLAGPMRCKRPSSRRRAICFSTARWVTPISSANSLAEKSGLSFSSSRIFSELFSELFSPFV